MKTDGSADLFGQAPRVAGILSSRWRIKESELALRPKCNSRCRLSMPNPLKLNKIFSARTREASTAATQYLIKKVGLTFPSDSINNTRDPSSRSCLNGAGTLGTTWRRQAMQVTRDREQAEPTDDHRDGLADLDVWDILADPHCAPTLMSEWLLDRIARMAEEER